MGKQWGQPTLLSLQAQELCSETLVLGHEENSQHYIFCCAIAFILYFGRLGH